MRLRERWEGYRYRRNHGLESFSPEALNELHKLRNTEGGKVYLRNLESISENSLNRQAINVTRDKEPNA